MTFYGPEELYEEGGLTVMEMICASPCLTSMICFSLEVKYGNMFNTISSMHRHRVGARGNATTFPLPWEDMLQELQVLDDVDAAPKVQLPRTGGELEHVAQVLLKTNDEDKRRSLQTLIHQAVVRRHFVEKCIVRMKQRGHRAYVLFKKDDGACYLVTTLQC